MKSTLTIIPHDVFYHPADALPHAWQGQTRIAGRRSRHRTARFMLDPDERKQEVICSVILTLCLIFSLAVCFAQFAVS